MLFRLVSAGAGILLSTLSNELDQVEAFHYTREVERQAIQDWRVAHPGQEHQKPQSKTGPPSASVLNRVPWDEFQESLDVIQSDRFAIDVLVGEPNVKITLPSLRYRTRGDGVRYGLDKKADLSGGATNASSTVANLRKPFGKTFSRGQGPLPERIRINSTAILRILNKISQEEISTDFPPVLMMRPFRGLIWYEDEIRKWRDDLEKNVIKTQIEAGKSRKEEEDLQDTTKEKDDLGDLIETNTQEALDDLNRLVDFIDHDLEDELAYLASEECTKVLWSDIWHLFKPGDFVVSKDEKQAYRVIKVKYATHSMKRPTGRYLWMPEAKAKLDDSPITIQCVFLDFDGERIGPVTQTIDIHRYGGERSILSLPVVPLRRVKDRSLKETLIKRGSMFIEACDPQRRGIPLHYSGLSLETQEEIDNQVVVDFEEAFSNNDLHGVQRNWKPELKDVDLGSDSDIDYVSHGLKNNFRRRRHDSYTDDGFDTSESEHLHYRSQMGRNCLPQCCSDEILQDEFLSRIIRAVNLCRVNFGRMI